MDPTSRLGARGDTRSILKHPFFRTVNWEAVFQKRVTPPVNPLTLRFLSTDPVAPGVADDLQRNPSNKNILNEAVVEHPPHNEAVVEHPPLQPHIEAVVEHPPLQPPTGNCPTIDPGASGAPDEDQSSCSFRTAVEGASDDASGSPSASEGAVLEGPARKAHTV